MAQVCSEGAVPVLAQELPPAAASSPAEQEQMSRMFGFLLPSSFLKRHAAEVFKI